MSAEQILLTLPVGVTWVLAVSLALLDGRRWWVGSIAALGLAVSLVSLFVLAFIVVRDGPVTLVAGGWEEGVGIAFRADALGVTFALVSVTVILAAMLYEVFVGVRWRAFPSLVLFVAAGLSGLFMTGDVFNFYVFFEISMSASFILTGYREEDYQVRGAFIFAVVNLLGSVIFLIGIAALYTVTGSLDMQVIAERTALLETGSVLVIAAVIFAAFFLKLGLFPFHFWLPAVYVGSHASVAAILSGALANIGSYGLLRFGADLLPRELGIGTVVVMVLGAASIIYGALQAVSRRDASEVMAYSAIGQVGYILLALAIGGPVGYTAAVLYSVVNSLNKGVVFLAAGIRGPLVGAAFVIGAFSIAGVPPAAGFLGKLAVFKAAIEGQGGLVGAGLVLLVFLGGAFSFLYSFQIYQRKYVRPGSSGKHPERDADLVPTKLGPPAARYLVFGLALVLLGLGLYPEPLVAVSQAAADVILSGGYGGAP
ncbi:complex I subunit 5 family protein [Rubrobacter indicoceani]|uniref:complex I subunit 5 family protein n=1 Tax=Rubrobacter indicoceani TaxID=2051957 RepID=UPI0019692A03|nr:proton-conducting transporter membrane subunit [Rubrobacter indicoceani]